MWKKNTINYKWNSFLKKYEQKQKVKIESILSEYIQLKTQKNKSSN